MKTYTTRGALTKRIEHAAAMFHRRLKAELRKEVKAVDLGEIRTGLWGDDAVEQVVAETAERLGREGQIYPRG